VADRECLATCIHLSSPPTVPLFSRS
jgi:hypothetical protein